MTRYLKIPLTAAATALALTATSVMAQSYPSDFAGLDADKNGQVTFAEYSAALKTSGMSRTAAAQQFTKISAGDAIITEEELSLALAFQDQPYALQNINGGANISYAATAPEIEPPVTEVQETPILESEPIIAKDAPADIMTETPTPEVDIIREAIPEMTEPITAATEPEIIMEEVASEIPEADIVEPEEIGDVLLEEDLEPQPEG